MNDNYRKPDQFSHKSDSPLGQIFKKAVRINFLQAQLDPILENMLPAKCLVANFYGPTLILAAENGTIATAVRMHEAKLLQAFQKNAHLQAFTTIQCKVYAPEMPQRPKRKEKPFLSEHGRTALLQIAESMTDEKLKVAMQRLANRTKESSS